MKLAITAAVEASDQAPIVLRGRYPDTLAQAAKTGFDAIEYHIADPAEVDAQEIRSAADTFGVAVSSLGTGLAFVRDDISLTSPDPSVRQSAVTRLNGFIELASQLGSVVIVGLIKGQIRHCGDACLFDSYLTGALEQCLPLAEAAGVTLVLEAMNRYESDNLNTLSECTRFTRKFRSQHLKVHIDTFHMNIEEKDIGSSIVGAGASVGHVHVADNNRLYPGAGHYDFAKTVHALREIGYHGALSVECLAKPDSETAAFRALHALGALLDRPRPGFTGIDGRPAANGHYGKGQQ